MSLQLTDLGFREAPTPLARLLSAIRHPVAGAVALLTVIGVVALPHPLPRFAPAAYALLGVAEGVGIAVAAENLLWRPATGFDVERASRRVGAVAAATATFVVAMAALGVDLGPRDRALLAGLCLSAPAATASIDYLKNRVRADLRSRETL